MNYLICEIGVTLWWHAGTPRADQGLQTEFIGLEGGEILENGLAIFGEIVQNVLGHEFQHQVDRMDMVNFHSVLELDRFFTEAHREAGSRLARLIEYSLRLMASYVRGPKPILVVVLLVLN